MAFAGLGVIALDIANVDEFGDDGDGDKYASNVARPQRGMQDGFRHG